MTLTQENLDRAVKKATKSFCRYKIAALGFDRRGDFIGSTVNRCRLERIHGAEHAEALLISHYRSSLKTIVICRTNKNGGVLPVHPCPLCLSMAKKYGIKIKTIGKEE